MSRFDRPIITLSTTDLKSDYFDSRLSPDSVNSNNKSIHYQNDPPITISNQHDNTCHYSLKKQGMDHKVHSAPNLQHKRIINPILQKSTNSSPILPRHINILDDDDFRRPSVITFANSDTRTIFYDAESNISFDDEDETPTRKRFTDFKSRRPSAMSHISSSAYTNKTAAISIDHLELEPSQYLHEGVLFCAVVSTQQKKMEIHKQSHHPQDGGKIPLKWKEYRAVITQSGYLELYNYCHCKNELFHMCRFHLQKKPQYTIDLQPSVNNKLFEKMFLVDHNSNKNTADYMLSLISAIDFSWSLSSIDTTFYFQSSSLPVSQQWYRSLYTFLPAKCKKLLPQYVDLRIPELSTCIRLPIDSLIQEEDENVDLRKVRESALVLLHRNGNRPSNWNKRTVGICWKLVHGDHEYLDWALQPLDDDHHIAYLIEPRLIEKTHELQMRYWEEQEDNHNTDDLPPQSIKGYISYKNIRTKNNPLMYAETLDQYLFLYQHKLQELETSSSLLRVCLSKKKYNQTHPDVVPTSPRSAIGVIDLTKIKEFVVENIPQDEDEPKQVLRMDGDRFVFELAHKSSQSWSESLQQIHDYYTNRSLYRKEPEKQQILQSGTIYIKSATNGRFHTFHQRLCILTRSGDFCIFRKSSQSLKPEYSISLIRSGNEPNIYIYSGEEVCSYITGLPVHWPSRIFDNGQVIDQNKPRQCCFVLRRLDKEYVSLTRSVGEKEAWVQSLFSFL